MSERLQFGSDAFRQLCRRHCVRRLALFGSRLKGTARADSDIDLLVEFEPGREPGLLTLSGMEIDFSHVLGGVKVDLRTAQDLSPSFRDEVVRSARAVYES